MLSKIKNLPSFAGIDMGLKTVFQGRDIFTYIVNKDHTITKARVGK